ncbi:MAG: sugar phosphate isomerase/epimerase family protein [Caldimicrobium sp.]|nr:sugar phosphate isomerase/epimerase [Caldimicrobium sp.]MDW8094678.1 sugar phosphate isomerase/epimerase family protein [Caldimicrobium sp.]
MENKPLIHISIPFELLKEHYLEVILRKRLSVEIILKAEILDREERTSFRRIADTLKNESITLSIHLPFMDLSLGALDFWVRKISLKRLFQGMEVASLFEPILCVFHSGYHPDYHREPQEEWRKIFTEEALPKILAFAEDLGIVLALENTFEPEPEFMLPIFQSYHERLGWCFDPGHARVFSERDELSWLTNLYPYLREIHCHDNKGKWDDHLPLGDGVIDFRRIFSFLKENNLFPILTIEAKREEDVFKSLKYLQQICHRWV